ncbi:hypothetical protein ACKI2N_032475 [Cupriavidus sp. 30B13]|uniref:hypothetical protein n=1 Tax=Cupriavidus sp. 30B13 TaxID=3384241 RepID=UPI003B91029B
MTESCAEMAEMADSDKAADQGALCLAHCQADSKTADHVSPQIPVFLPVLLSVLSPIAVTVSDFCIAMRAETEARAPPPALTILHCSYQT